MKRTIYLSIIFISLFLGGCTLIQSSKQQDELTCGGIAGIECPSGYVCELSENKIADRGGICTRIMYDPLEVEEARRISSGLCKTDFDYVITENKSLNCTCPMTFRLFYANKTGAAPNRIARCVYEDANSS